MMEDMEDGMPEYEKEERDIETKTKAETMKVLLQEYQKRYNEMSGITEYQ